MPDPPVELDQVTCSTPTLSCAVPLRTMELAEVETVVIAGERMVIDGATVSPPVAGLIGVVGGLFPGEFPEVGSSLVTVMLCDA